MAQWERIHLPVQEAWVRSLIQEDPTCKEQLNSHATIIELVLLGLALQKEKSPQREACRPMVFFFWWGGFPLVGIPLPLFPGGKNWSRLPSTKKNFPIQCALCYNLHVLLQCLWAKSWNAAGNVNDYENANCALRGCREPTPVFLPGEPHGQRILEGLLGHKELDTTCDWTTSHN